MRWQRTVTVVGAHAEGEIGRVIIGGVLPPPGRTMFERMKYLETEADDLRQMPEVATVAVAVGPRPPMKRIIHIRNCYAAARRWWGKANRPSEGVTSPETARERPSA